MDKGTKNYRDMMKRMEKMDPNSVVREGEINLERPGGMMGGTPADLIKSKPEETAMGKMGAGTREAFDMMKTLDPKSIVREGEMAGMSALESAISNMPMADREAIEALTSMGISLEDAVEAILDPNAVARRDEMLEGAVGATMGGGALGALPMQRPAMRDDMGADRTQSMDMQKEGMGT